MAQYIVDEFKDKRGEEIDVSQWARHCPKDIPHQENLCDCGVFMVTFGDYMVREQAPLGLSPRMLFHHATHNPQPTGAPHRQCRFGGCAPELHWVNPVQSANPHERAPRAPRLPPPAGKRTSVAAGMIAPRLSCNTRVRGNGLSHEPSSSCVHWWRLVCSDRTGARRSAASGAVI